MECPPGSRFGAAITTVKLAVVLVTGSVSLLAVQAVVFAAGRYPACGTHPTAC